MAVLLALTIVRTFAPAAAAAAALKTAENLPEPGSAADASDELLHQSYYKYFFWLLIIVLFVGVGNFMKLKCSGEVRPTCNISNIILTTLSHRCDAFIELNHFLVLCALSLFLAFLAFFRPLLRALFT